MSSSQNPDNEAASASDTGLKIWSCVICRRRKVRCDRRDPCSNCVKNNIDCHYPVTGRIPRRSRDPTASKSPAQKQSELLGRLRRLESVVTELAAQVEDGSQDSGLTAAPGQQGLSDARSVPSSETSQALVTPAGSSLTETSQVASFAQEDGNEFNEEFGRLLVDKDGALHVGNRFWSVFCSEVRHPIESYKTAADRPKVDNILQAVHDVAEYSESSNGSTMPEPSIEGGPTPLSHLGFVFGNADFAKALDGLNPLPSQMLFIWQTFVENVNPFIKVLHVPTVEKVIRALRGNFSAYGSKTEALLFAVSLAAITSMDEEEVAFNFNTPKTQLLQRYQFGTEQALARADFLVTKDITVLQALIIYLSLLPHLGAHEKVWPMMGLVLRLARSMGLHRDDDGHHRSQLEQETRRRLWWQLCFLDSRSRRAEALELSITPASFDTALPWNMNDIDLEYNTTHSPVAQEKVTDTTLCLISCELWRLSQSLRSNVTIPEARLELFRSSRAKVDAKYLSHLQPNRPWDNLVKTMATLFFAKLELVMHRQPGIQPLVATSLEPAISIIQCAHSLLSEPSWSKWRWQLQGQLPWHAIGIFLRQACRRPWTLQLEEAWNATKALLDTASEDIKKTPIWHSLMELYAKAKVQRGEKLSRQATEAPVESLAASHAPLGQTFNTTGNSPLRNDLDYSFNVLSALDSSLNINPPSLENLPMEHQDTEPHTASSNPLLWSSAIDLDIFEQHHAVEYLSLLDDPVLMDWEALIDVNETWATWDFL
ncbi:hypothetical protein FZEAL_1217 [Fusarium zealandicum]|uniref:Zn(2)-C6 fungal-type domain-containing protein n=1 Tax=Fusarium zealandicum TaxID=1053134 RepID=A0A8H4XNZ9_9HYPO|nr:hypothetical protein FZEAL_1217 [Fusarium zealandicum]